MVAGSRSSRIRCSTAFLASSTATPVCLSAPAPETKTRWGALAPESASARFRPWRSSPPGPAWCALPLANTASLPGAGFPGIRPPHCQVLRGIEPGGSRLTDLAAGAQMTKQSMGALVDHLEAAGYVERIQDREDARVKAIRLTPRGRHAAQAIAD